MQDDVMLSWLRVRKVLEPPPPRSVTGAVTQLQTIGALTPSEHLTPLGVRLMHVLLPAPFSVTSRDLIMGQAGCLFRLLHPEG